MERTAQLETLLREKEELEKVVLQPKPVMVSARRGWDKTDKRRVAYGLQSEGLEDKSAIKQLKVVVNLKEVINLKEVLSDFNL